MWKDDVTEEEAGYICGSEKFTNIVTKNFSVFNIIFFETTASALFAYSIIEEGGFLLFLSFLICSGTLFVAFLWAGRFCGAILNPAVAILHMIKKEKKLSILKGLLYILCQFAGTILGCVIGFYVTSFNTPAMVLLQAKILGTQTGILFFQSFITTFIFCVVMLTLISTDVTFVELELQVWITVPALYVTVSGLSGITIGVNPFFGLVFPFFNGYFTSNWASMTYCWPLVIAPLIGSVASAFFFQYFYRRFVYVYKQQLRQQQQMLKRQQFEEAQRRKRSVLELI